MAFQGKWNFDRVEKLAEFMKAVGAPAEAANEAASLTGYVEYSQAGSSYTVKTVSSGGTIERTFQFGKPFEMEFPGYGKKAMVVASDEGGKLVFKGDDITETREIKGNAMVVTLTKPGVDIIGKCFLKKA
ncbi:fatty acid-binding protein 2, liver-like [Ptychodera flava]|uniref:fatty acid-binding protein 2, liver-like n=1 Tax=Ptychodera flava TaxID=63121 RepID=UPI00396A5E70